MIATFSRVLATYCVIIIFIGCSKRTVVFPYETMMPTIQPGARIQLETGVFKYRNPERFDIVTFTPTLEPRHAKVEWVLRVIGLPGETIAIQEGKVLVNGVPLGFPPPLHTVEYQPRSKASKDIRIPTPIRLAADELFLLADNPTAVTDSREIGPVLLKQLKARVVILTDPTRQP